MDQKRAGEFSGISDEQLAAMAASDRSALAALIIRYDRFISSKADAMKTSGADADDLFQEGIMGLLDAIKSFDPSRGVTLRTFANVCIRNRMINAISGKTPHISIDDIGEDISAGEENPEAIVVQREHDRELFEDISQKLTASEWGVLQLFLKGFSYAEIADQLHMQVKAVDNAMQRVRRKLRAILRT